MHLPSLKNIILAATLTILAIVVPLYAVALSHTTITYPANTTLSQNVYTQDPPLSSTQTDILLGAAVILFIAGGLLATQVISFSPSQRSLRVERRKRAHLHA